MKKWIFGLRYKRFFLFYGITFLVSLVAIYFLIYSNSENGHQASLSIWTRVVPRLLSEILFWTVLLLPFLLFLLVKNLIENYKKSGLRGLFIGLFLKIGLPFLILFSFSKGLDYYRMAEKIDFLWDHSFENKSEKTKNYYAIDNKQRGIHTFGISHDLDDLRILKNNNFEWITLTPFVGQPKYNAPSLSEIDSTRYQDIKGRYKRIKRSCDSLGIKIMLKPHIWLNNRDDGEWRSDIAMTSEEDWNLWFSNYEKVILAYAKIAQELDFEQFCIGTELEATVAKKPEKWLELIQLVRDCYAGKITYASNWYKGYTEVPFWGELDYIGIQGYFPLGESTEPTLVELENAWKPYIKQMAEVSKKFNTPVLFTEIGYRSLKGTAKKPWEWVSLKSYYSKISKKEQMISYQAFFNTLWKEPWFHGIHIWEWQSTSKSNGDNTSFTLENKPALNIVAKNFKLDL